MQLPKVTLEGPGTGSLEVEKPGTLKLEYRYQTRYEGRWYEQSPDLPPDWTFELVAPDGSVVPMEGKESGTAFGNAFDDEDEDEIRKSKSVTIGRFPATQPGTYTLRIAGEGEPRVFRLQRDFDHPAFVIFSCCLGPFASAGLGVASLVMIILGIVDLCRQPRSAAKTLP